MTADAGLRRFDGGDEVVAALLEIVSAQTGYPADMLELDLDLEADLGIDTVKQAEIFAAVRERYGIERDPDLKLKEFNTLAKTAAWVRSKRARRGRRARRRRSRPRPSLAAEPATPEPPATPATQVQDPVDFPRG